MVKNRWVDHDVDEIVAEAGENPADQELARRVYSSRLIGQDPDLVLHGGGNTSCKLARQDIFGEDIDILHIKGSGWDLATIKAEGFPAVRLDPLHRLRGLASLSDEDMVNMQRCNLLDSNAPNPSVETLLHAYLPHKYVDHTHATAMLALASLPDVEEVVEEIFGAEMVVVPFIMPGFELAKVAADIYDANPHVNGLLLKQHGHFAFANSAKASYDLIIKHTNMVEAWFDKKCKAAHKNALAKPASSGKTSEILPVLRGVIGGINARFQSDPDRAMPVMELRTSAAIDKFLQRPDLETLSKRGVATPDHVIRTKNHPLLVSDEILKAGRQGLVKAIDMFVDEYTRYFRHNAERLGQSGGGEITMLTPTPNLAWIKGMGIVGIGSDAKAANISADLAEQTVSVMDMAQASSGFFPVNKEQIFDMEYWSLEQAKLAGNKPMKLQGRVVMITGGGGAIGCATAKAFAAMGASVFLVELSQDKLDQALLALGSSFHGGMVLDITADGAANAAIDACIRQFGGLDILLCNAGAAYPGEIKSLDEKLLRQSFELNFFAHQCLAAAAARLFETQGQGGQILFNVSKQAVNPGKGFGAYGLPKAATMALLRQLALELGPAGVRVNGVNADRIRSGLLTDELIGKRSVARGVDEDTYMAGNLLGLEVEALHVAEAFVALALSERTTAHVMTVDGGNIEASLR